MSDFQQLEAFMVQAMKSYLVPQEAKQALAAVLAWGRSVEELRGEVQALREEIDQLRGNHGA